MQPYSWPWGLWKWHSLRGCGKAGRWKWLVAPCCCLDHEETPPRYHHGVLQPSGLLSPQQGRLARLFPTVMLGQVPLSEERAWWYKFFPSPGSHCYKCLCFTMGSELSSKIIHDISPLVLMSVWHMFAMGTWRTLCTSTREKSAYFTFNVKPPAVRALQVAARWNRCWFISCRIGWVSPDLTGTWSPEATQEDPDLPRLSIQSVTQPTYCLKPLGEWGGEPRPASASFSCCSFSASGEILLKMSNMYQCSATEFLPHLS